MAFSGSVLTGVDSFIFGWHDCLHDIPSTCGGLEWEMFTFLEFGRCDTILGPTTWKALGKSVDKTQPKNEGKSRRTKRPRSLIMSSFFFHISSKVWHTYGIWVGACVYFIISANLMLAWYIDWYRTSLTCSGNEQLLNCNFSQHQALKE